MTAPHGWIIQHKRMKTYWAEHPLYEAYLTDDKAKATRYATKADAIVVLQKYADSFHHFYEVTEDTDATD